MNLAPCKNCASRLTPVEQPVYCDRAAKACGCPKTSFVSLSNITSYNCSVARQTDCDREMPKNVRTTASGINDIPKTTWTCKRCTLLNNAGTTVCEACEGPYISDMNSNLSPGVLIKVNEDFSWIASQCRDNQVDNWADNEALRLNGQACYKPMYRRSLSELPTVQNPTNRHSLEVDAFPKSSSSMTDIQSSQNVDSLFKSSGSAGEPSTQTLYTYIGMTEPDKTKNHVYYKNKSVINAQRTEIKFDAEQHAKV